MHQRNIELTRFMEENTLTPQDVAELTGVNVNTVYMWRASNGLRVIPATKLELLKLKTAAKKTA